MSNKKSFTIDRSTWRCGAGQNLNSFKGYGLGKTLMLNEEGFKCCLGHIATQCGFTDEQLLGWGDPNQCVFNNKKTKSTNFLTKISDNGMFVENTDLANAAIAINDTSKLSNKQRESELIKLFKKEGYELTFTGKYFKSKR